MKILLMVLIFLLMTGFFIISNNNIALKEPSNVSKFINLYSMWISDIFDNFVTITGNSIGLTWLPEQNFEENINSS